jgi:hypothetical protein
MVAHGAVIGEPREVDSSGIVCFRPDLSELLGEAFLLQPRPVVRRMPEEFA